ASTVADVTKSRGKPQYTQAHEVGASLHGAPPRPKQGMPSGTREEGCKNLPNHASSNQYPSAPRTGRESHSACALSWRLLRTLSLLTSMGLLRVGNQCVTWMWR